MDKRDLNITVNVSLNDIHDIISKTCCEGCKDKCWEAILDKAAESLPKNFAKEILRQQFESLGQEKPPQK